MQERSRRCERDAHISQATPAFHVGKNNPLPFVVETRLGVIESLPHKWGTGGMLLGPQTASGA